MEERQYFFSRCGPQFDKVPRVEGMNFSLGGFKHHPLLERILCTGDFCGLLATYLNDALLLVNSP